ncbi:hypothetical protein N9937_00170 [bacterium]|nr:hypothetical protein [bacterium]
MSIGLGIAIAGVWLFPTACALSRVVSSWGFNISIAAAVGTTYMLLGV